MKITVSPSGTNISVWLFPGLSKSLTQAQYKTIEVENPNLTNLKNDQSLTFQLQHAFQSLKNAIQHNLQCNARQRTGTAKDIYFHWSATGRETYTWRDY